MTLLEKNLRALEKRNPALAERLAEDVPGPTIEVLPTKDGVHTARVVGEDGKGRLLHSRHAPVEEARTTIDRFDPDNCDCFIVYGFGFGYHVLELFRRSKDVSIIFIVEKEPAIIRKAMEVVDLADVLASRRVFLSVPENKTALFDVLKPFVLQVSAGTQVVDHQPSLALFASFYREAMKWVADFFTYGRRAMVAIFALNIATTDNMMYNLPYYLFSPGLGSLKDRYKGFPAIIVSAGPSLHKNIELLAEAKGRALIITVPTVYKTLLGRGIRPDLVCVVDYHPVSKTYFDGIAPEDGVPLVASAEASWLVLDSHKGDKFLAANRTLAALLTELDLAKTAIRSAATVAHLAFYLAELVGADPVILVGQDLAHPDGITHMPGTATHDGWQAELNRFNSLEMKEWEEIARRRDILTALTDVHGNTVYTDDQMFNYLQQFESDFLAAQPRTVIDATEGGARKRHTKPMPLREAIDRYCTRPIPALNPEQLLSVEALPPEEGPRALALLAERKDETRTVMGLFRKTLGFLTETQRKLDDPVAANRLIRKIHANRDRLHREHERIFGLVVRVNQSNEMLKLRRDKEILAVDASGIEKQRMQLERDIEYVRSLLKGAERLLSLIDTGSMRLREYISGDLRRDAR